MAENKVVSIVVPIYNQEKYLDISIPSLINQIYSNIEIILVNDGSTDNSRSIIEKYALLDSRIKITNKTNGGLVDATLTGIENACGDYIAFLDPDDRVGEDFISNFMINIDEDTDVIAAGFYRSNAGRLDPYYLLENAVYTDLDLDNLKQTFLYQRGTDGIPKKIFVSRWNKLYKAECVQKASVKFSRFKGVSLGEDTIFTYLILNDCKRVKTLSAPNSYYYNVGNQSSMMKNTSVELHLLKAKKAYDAFFYLLKENGNDTEQAYALYYHLVNSIFGRTLKEDRNVFGVLYKKLTRDEIYQKALILLENGASGKKSKYIYMLRRNCKNQNLYIFLTDGMKNRLKKIKFFINDCTNLIKNTQKIGLKKALRMLRFSHDRRNAFIELREQLPILEERITPFFDNYINIKTDLSKCPVVNKIFVFWWDGFDKAPSIVAQCLKSVKRHNPGFEVVEISKHNYKDYTNINPAIMADVDKGKISLQTFSDILRFNLLKNNGGVWIDATIFFTDEYNLTSRLTDKSFESVEFSSSNNFLKYKDKECSWSGYFIASRKNGVFVTAMDYVFEQYYLKYGTYSIYFFIDAAFMIAKINKIDDGVLDKVHYNSGDMFVLMKLINSQFSPMLLKTIGVVPQKLQWMYKADVKEDSVYSEVILKNEGQ